MTYFIAIAQSGETEIVPLLSSVFLQIQSKVLGYNILNAPHGLAMQEMLHGRILVFDASLQEDPEIPFNVRIPCRRGNVVVIDTTYRGFSLQEAQAIVAEMDAARKERTA